MGAEQEMYKARGHRAGGKKGGGGQQAQKGGGGVGGGGAGGAANAGAGAGGGRRGFPWINMQIIKASEYCDVHHLFNTVATHLPYMNLVNMTTAVHRLAKLTAHDPEGQNTVRQHPTMDALLEAISDTLNSSATMGESQSQSLSNIAWSLATIRRVEKPLVNKVATLAATRISFFKPFELSTLLWALAKLGAIDNVSSGTRPVFHTSAAHIMRHIECFSFRCLATTVWAFATSKHHNAKLFRAVATSMMPMVRSANPQEMANTAWAFATANFHDDHLFTQLAQQAVRRLDEFKAQELSNMLWGFASNNFFHEAFYVNASMAARRMPLGAQHLANILCAFARARPNHPATRDTMLALLPWCTAQIEAFKPQEVSATLLAAAKVFAKCPEQDSEADLPLSREPYCSEGADLTEVNEFFSVAAVWALPRVKDFSAQSLANTTRAVSLLQMGGCADLLRECVSAEALRRSESLSAPKLAQLLKGLPLPTDSNSTSSDELTPKLEGRAKQDADRQEGAAARASPTDGNNWRGKNAVSCEDFEAIRMSLACEEEPSLDDSAFPTPAVAAAAGGGAGKRSKARKSRKEAKAPSDLKFVDVIPDDASTGDSEILQRTAIEQDPAVLSVHRSSRRCGKEAPETPTKELCMFLDPFSGMATMTFKWRTSVKNSFVHVDIEVFEDGIDTGGTLKMFGDKARATESPEGGGQRPDIHKAGTGLRSSSTPPGMSRV